jgi:hypothetical protein
MGGHINGVGRTMCRSLSAKYLRHPLEVPRGTIRVGDSCKEVRHGPHLGHGLGRPDSGEACLTKTSGST